jgi:ABC-type Fe3+ transport system substrate-binding protein
VLLQGDFIMYGITLLDGAPNRAAAIDFLAYIAGPRGKAVFAETGQNTISPPVISGNGKLPEPVQKSISQ